MMILNIYCGHNTTLLLIVVNVFFVLLSKYIFISTSVLKVLSTSWVLVDWRLVDFESFQYWICHRLLFLIILSLCCCGKLMSQLIVQNSIMWRISSQYLPNGTYGNDYSPNHVWSWYLLNRHFMLHLLPETFDQKPAHWGLPRVEISHNIKSVRWVFSVRLHACTSDR